MKKTKIAKTFIWGCIFTLILWACVTLFTGSVIEGHYHFFESLNMNPAYLVTNTGWSRGFGYSFERATQLLFNFSWFDQERLENVNSFASSISSLGTIFQDFNIGLSGAIAYWAVILIALICVIVLTILAIKHKNAKYVWTMLFGVILATASLYTIAFIHVGVFGARAWTTYNPGGWDPSQSFFYQMAVGGYNGIIANGASMVTLTYILYLLFLLVIVVSILGVVIASIVYICKAFIYANRHKYDYLTRRERKEKVKYYKEHGFKNINDQKKKKGGEPTPTPLGPQYAGASMYAQAPVNGAPAPAYPYGYPFSYVENIHHQYILIFRKK